MFTYWNGYEVDGSSTTYNIVVPERRLVAEVMRYFLNLKLIDRNSEISLSFSEERDSTVSSLRKPDLLRHENEIYRLEDVDKLCEIIEKPSTKWFCINTSCIHPDKLYHEVRNELYDISKTRPGAEGKVYKYKNPTVSPLYYGPDLGLTFEVTFGDEEKAVEDYAPEGLIFNREALISNLKGTHFTIDFGCGPGFIFEYAAYIVSKMAERFPEIGIDGGIDCAGGFVDGCTYSSSLYAYEKIRIDTLNIGDTIKQILKNREIQLQKRTGSYGHEIVPCNNLFLFNLYNVDKSKDEHISANMKIVKGIMNGKTEYTPEEYETFVKKVAEIPIFDRIDFMHYCTCCFKKDNKFCAITCVKENDGVWLELRVTSELSYTFEKELRLIGLTLE